jgi:hypothetical protein
VTLYPARLWKVSSEFEVSATPRQKVDLAVMLLSHFERGNILFL